MREKETERPSNIIIIREYSLCDRVLAIGLSKSTKYIFIRIHYSNASSKRTAHPLRWSCLCINAVGIFFSFFSSTAILLMMSDACSSQLLHIINDARNAADHNGREEIMQSVGSSHKSQIDETRLVQHTDTQRRIN